MKYILIASLLSCAVYAAPFAQQAGAGNGNGQNTQQQQGQQQQGQQIQQGQQTQGQQGQQQQGVQNGNANNNVNTPLTGPQTGTGAGIANGQTPSSADLATAVSNWQADTSMVSDFLNRGPTIQNNVAFKQAATVAFNAEVDELNHKAVIDAANSADPNVIAANSTLATGGAFQDVVDKLQQMSQQGLAAVGNIDLINQNRCVNVLPNIDAYMASTGSASQAIRPTVCDQTGVAGGVQGTGATQPGQAAGSPAAAFAAAQALAAGTGNGLVQNGAAAGGQQQVNQGQQQQGQQVNQGQQQGGQVQQQQGQQQAAQGQQQAAPAQGQTPTQAQDPTQQQGTTPAQQQGALQSTGGQGQTTPQQGQQAAGNANQATGNVQQGQAGGAANGGAATSGQTGGAATGATQ